MSKSITYGAHCLAASGLAIMNWHIALELRPDLWGGAQDCRLNFQSKQAFPGTHRLTATLEGYGEVLVYARSLDLLESRIEWICGRRVLDLKPTADEPPPARHPSLLEREAAAKEDDRIAGLRKLAAQDLPDHDCRLRDEILAARAELGLSLA